MSSTQEKRCRTCVHWGLDMICQNEDSDDQGYTCMPGAACGHWEGTGEPEVQIAEVRHGEWRESWYTDTVCASICTNCGKATTQARTREDMTNVRYPLRPHCGARMNGGV